MGFGFTKGAAFDFVFLLLVVMHGWWRTNMGGVTQAS